MLTQSSINAHFEGRMKSSTVTQLDTSSFSESFSKKDKNINENLLESLSQLPPSFSINVDPDDLL